MIIGTHFIARRLLDQAVARGRRNALDSVFRCAAGFEAMNAVAPDGVRFEAWDEREPAERFLERVDAVVGLPSLELLQARDRVADGPPFLMMLMGAATRGVPLPRVHLERMRSRDALISTCRADVRILREFLAVPSASSLPIAPMPMVEAAFDAPASDEAEMLAERWRSRGPMLLSAERFVPSKGIHHTARFAAELRRLGVEVEIAVVRLETAPDRAYARSVTDMLERAGVPIHPLPRIDRPADLALLYRTASLTVSASTIYDNNFGYIPIESMMQGTPPVVSDWGGYHDSVVDGSTGIHMPTSLDADGEVHVHVEDAATRAKALLESPEAAASYGERGHARFASTYSLKASAKQYADAAASAIASADGEPWGVTELGADAIASGWARHRDNLDRTARIHLDDVRDDPRLLRLHQTIYRHYATETP